MADIRPFAAIRPAWDKAEEIAALPYDVYNRAEARAYVQANPGTFLAIDRPETFFAEDYDMYAPEVYEKAHDELWARVESGDFVREEAPCYFLYEQTFRGRTQRGIVAVASVDDYLNDVVKKHENTREEKERDRIRHVDVCDAQTGPIFLCYRKEEALSALLTKITEDEAALQVSFTGPDGSRNRIFRIGEEEQIRSVREAFAGMPQVYIADGHHRCASAVKVALKRRKEAAERGEALPAGEAPYDHFLCVLFADEELEIMDYNRVVTDLNGLSAEAFLARVSESFTVTPYPEGTEAESAKPDRKGTCSMYLDGRWYALAMHEDVKSSDPVEGLDVSVLQTRLLTPVLGIADPRTDKRIDFVGGIRGLKELERRCGEDCRVAFAMYPTSIAELFAVADKNLLMPPKSTWFEPKLLSGLFINALSPRG